MIGFKLNGCTSNCTGPCIFNSEPNHSKNDFVFREEDELSWDDIQTLAAAFVVSILAAAAHKGNISSCNKNITLTSSNNSISGSIFWTLMFLLSIVVCGIWWAYDKTNEIGDALTKFKISDPRTLKDSLINKPVSKKLLKSKKSARYTQVFIYRLYD